MCPTSEKSHPEPSLTSLEAELKTARDAGERIWEAVSMSRIGHHFIETGALKEAIRPVEKSVGIFDVEEAHVEQAVELCNLGWILLKLRRPIDALARLESALRIVHSEEPHETCEALTLENMALAYDALDEPIAMARSLEQALISRNWMEQLSRLPALHVRIGSAYEHTGFPDLAVRHFKSALEDARAYSAQSLAEATWEPIGGTLWIIGAAARKVFDLRQERNEGGE